MLQCEYYFYLADSFFCLSYILYLYGVVVFVPSAYTVLPCWLKAGTTREKYRFFPRNLFFAPKSTHRWLRPCLYNCLPALDKASCCDMTTRLWLYVWFKARRKLWQAKTDPFFPRLEPQFLAPWMLSGGGDCEPAFTVSVMLCTNESSCSLFPL